MRSGKDIEARMKLQRLIDKIAKWSDKTFGDDRILVTGKLSHLLLETQELIDCIKKYQDTQDDELYRKVLFEYADCFMLIIDSARMFGLNAENLIYITNKKLNINMKREWGKLDNEGKAMHIKQESKKG